jgi:hypothetical protein
MARVSARTLQKPAKPRYVDHEGVEAKVAKHLGAFMGVFTDADSFWKYQNAGPLGAGVVPDREPLTFVALVLVFNDSRLVHCRLRNC